MPRAAGLALVLFGFFAYFNAIHHPFVQDDVVFILKNPRIADLQHWPQAFEAPVVSQDINPYYRPLLEIIYRLEYHFFGSNAIGYHLVNIILHAVNGLLLFGLLIELGIALHLAWVAALFFLVHPVQTEAVACIAGISNLWMAFCVLSALHAYLKRWYPVCLLFFTLGFLGKEQAVLLLPLVLVIDCSRRQKNEGAWVLVGLWTILLLWLRQHVTGASLLRDIMQSPGELYLRLAAIPRDLGMYLRLIFFPYDLHYYRSTDILGPNTASWLLALISFMGIWIVWMNVKARQILVLGLGWFLAALLPVLNIAPVINEYSFILTSEHFLYLPIIGILIITITAADHFIKHFKKLIFGLLLCTCFILTWHQNMYWRNEIALFERMLSFEPRFGRGHLLLAKAYYFNRQPQFAEGHFRQAFNIISGYARMTPNEKAQTFYLSIEKEILFDWAQNESAMGQWASALGKYKDARLIDGRDASLYNNMAFVYLHMGNKAAALHNLQEAVQIDPSFTQARHNLEQLNRP